MRCLKAAISGSNLYLKLAIFVTGVVTGLDSSLRQLLMQFLLFLAYLLLEPSLFLALFQAGKRILPFMAGYWMFATLFGQNFPDSVIFSIQIIYLLIITVAVFGNLKLANLAADSARLRRYKPLNALFYYAIATYLFLRSFFANYKGIKAASPALGLVDQVSAVFSDVSQGSPQVQTQVRQILQITETEGVPNFIADFCGLLFLALLVFFHGI